MAKDSAGRKLPWFKLWPRDFMSDPVIQAMSFDKRGRFIWACMCSWETDTPGMATEDQWRKWLGYSWEGWEANHLDYPLIPGDMGALLVQKRLLYEFQQTRQEMERRSNAGLTGARARWGADAVAMRSHSGGNGNPSEGRRQRAEEPKTVSPEPSDPTASGPFVLPALGGKFWNPTPNEVESMILAFPGVSVESEFARMKAWLLANRTKMKTLRGLPRFANGWLSRQQDSSKPATTTPQSDGWEVTR